MASFPEEVLEHVFSFIHSHRDRNSISLVCKSWLTVERWCRRRVFVGNCYAVSPEIVIRRFPKIRSVSLKGKPHFVDFQLVPYDLGGNVRPWIAAMAKAYPWLEELRLKRMVITDESLELLSHSFQSFKVLVLTSCQGFSTDGLAAIATNCRLQYHKIAGSFHGRRRNSDCRSRTFHGKMKELRLQEQKISLSLSLSLSDCTTFSRVIDGEALILPQDRRIISWETKELRLQEQKI